MTHAWLGCFLHESFLSFVLPILSFFLTCLLTCFLPVFVSSYNHYWNNFVSSTVSCFWVHTISASSIARKPAFCIQEKCPALPDEQPVWRLRADDHWFVLNCTCIETYFQSCYVLYYTLVSAWWKSEYFSAVDIVVVLVVVLVVVVVLIVVFSSSGSSIRSISRSVRRSDLEIAPWEHWFYAIGAVKSSLNGEPNTFSS